jgi:ribosomal protein L20
MPRKPTKFELPKICCVYPDKTKRLAKKLVMAGFSLREVKRKLGLLCSKTTIGRWSRTNFDTRSVKKRQMRKVWIPLLLYH